MAFFRLIRGALAGFLATGPMTAAMEAMYHFLPWWERYPLPPRLITARFTRAIGLRKHMNHHEHSALTMLAHFAYGAAAGAIYSPLARSRRMSPLASGTAFGLCVWTLSYLGLLPAVGALPPATKHPRGRNVLMITAHIVYGATLGFLFDRLNAGRSRPPG